MEVTGIPPQDPNGGERSSSVNALAGVTPIIDVLDKIEDNTSNILSVVAGMKTMIKTSLDDLMRINSNIFGHLQDLFLSSAANPGQTSHTTALIANTEALSELTSMISSATIDVTVDGSKSTFFSKLMDVAGNDKKLTGLETFTKIYESTIIRIANLEKYAPNIDRTAQALFGAFGTFKEFGKGLMFFSGGLALLGFTLVTFMEAITLNDILTFGAIMLVLRGAAEIVGKGSWDLAKVSVGIATLGLAVWGFTKLVDSKLGAEFLVSMGFVSLGVGMLGAMSKLLGGNTTQNLIRGAVGVAAIAGSVWILNKAVADFDDIDLVKAGKMVLVTGGLAVVWGLMGSSMSLILQGSASAAAIGGSLWLLTKGIRDMSTIDISLTRGLELAAIIVGAAGVLTLIGNPVTIAFTLAGAAGAAAIGAALWVLSKGMNAIASTNVTSEQANAFGSSLERTVDALMYLGNPITAGLLLIATPAALAVAASTVALSGAMFMIANTKVLSKSHYENYGGAIESIVDLYSDLGLWGLAKATAAAGVVTLISTATMLSAGAITSFTKLSSSPDAVGSAVLSLDNFITGVSESFKRNKDNFKYIGENVNKFMGMSSMVKEIAASVQSIANLEFYEKKIVNGQVVVTDVRKFTPEDFANVGHSIGSILNALTDPLAKIASEKDSFSIGGFTITNPFSNKVQKGIESMMNVGSVFTPLSQILTVFTKEGINSQYIASFNKDLASLLNGMGVAFSQDGINIDEDMVELLSDSANVVNKMIQETKQGSFGKAVNNFSVFTKDVAAVKKSMNDIDLSKLTKFNTMLYHVNELKKTDAISELVEVFGDLIEKLVDLEKLRQQPVQITQQQGNQTTETVIVEKQQSGNNGDQLREFLLESNDEIVDAIHQLHQLMASGQLQVRTKQSQF